LCLHEAPSPAQAARIERVRIETAMLKAIFRSVLGLPLLLASISGAQHANAPAPGIDVYDGFEAPGLSKLWDTSKFVPGAVTIQSEVVRAGHSAAKIVLHTHDKFEAGINGNQDSERAELMEARELVSRENLTYEYSFSMFIPTDFPIVPTRLVIAQWKQYCPRGGRCSDDSPVVAMRYVSGVLRIIHQIGRHQTTFFETSENLRGKWTDFKFRICFSTGENGRVEAWLNAKQVVDYAGVNAYAENATTSYPNPGWFYFKMGLYRDVMAEPMTIYVDEYRKKQLPDEEH
jgi:hypothetical protein